MSAAVAVAAVASLFLRYPNQDRATSFRIG
jgi:hypothetical protein